MFERPDHVQGNNKLHVCTGVFNSARYRSRYKLFEDFAKHIAELGAELYVVEVAYGNRKFVVTEEGNPRHLQLRTPHELWFKENAINLLVQRLPLDWEYVAWVDADTQFVRMDAANETVQKLQHFDVVQMWSEAHDLSPSHEIIKTFKSFMWGYYHPGQVPPNSDGGYYYPDKPHGKIVYNHSGYAWAARRSAFNTLGGLIDWSILGSADHIMCHHLVQRPLTLPYSLGPNGDRWLETWRKRAVLLNKNIGYVEGALLHNWHGKKKDRQYKTRGQIFNLTHFDPETHLKRDWQGLWALVDGYPLLRDLLRQYLHSRNEDSIDLE